MVVPYAMQLGGEALSIVALYGVYNQAQALLPPGVYPQTFAGGLAGATLAAIALPLNSNTFPETSTERRAVMPGQAWRTVVKSAAGYACFFAVAEGLRTGVYKARLVGAERDGRKLPPREDDNQWHGTNFAAGAVAGLAYRAATLPFFRGPMENPLLTKSGIGILIGTMLGMGTLMAGMGWVDVTQGLEVYPERWSLSNTQKAAAVIPSKP
ncbi:hypothetical protein DFS34DRAFT_196127 [Phlyctochytrium arcticum]|nr:hypothetical protein DFS34DRAFT_196127 [Phlyctochytrium arcticum]